MTSTMRYLGSKIKMFKCGQKRQLSSDNDQSSPEDLKPVKDPYSSDNEKHNNIEMKMSKDDKTMILPSCQQSSNMSGPEVLFFFDIDFIAQPKQMDMRSASVQEILLEIFKFLHGYERKEGHDKHFKKYGKTMDEIFEDRLKKHSWLRWIVQNDFLNFKSCSRDDWYKNKDNFMKMKYSSDCQLCDVDRLCIKSVYDMSTVIYENYVGNKCTDYHQMMSIFRLLGPILPISSHLRYSGETEFRINLRVPADLVFKSSTQIHLGSLITFKPDCVFQTENEYNRYTTTGKIIVHVVKHNKENSSSEDEIKLFEKKLQEQESDESKVPVVKPARTADALLSISYKKEAVKYLRQNFLKLLRDRNTSTLVGQHVVQLIGLADDQQNNVKFYSKVPIVEYTPVGLILKNEYLLFSKLNINDSKLFTYQEKSVRLGQNKVKGIACFSPWCLDLTFANHRIALVIALLELLDDPLQTSV